MNGTVPEFGVVYKPPPSGSTQANPVNDKVLDQLNIRWIRLTWNDWTNTIRYHVLSRSFFGKILGAARPGTSVTSAAFGIVGLHVCEGFSVTGEYVLTLDLSSFRTLPYEPGHASVLCFFEHQLPDPQYGLEMLDDPRTQLRRIERLAREQAGVSYIVGFESEFTLLKSTSPPVYVNHKDYGMSSKLASGSIEAKVMQEIAEALEDAGIEVQKYHAEAAPGQFEMITGPLPPLQAADALINTRETIFNVASKNGLRATFAPRLHVYSAGNAAHVHMSIHDLGTHPDSQVSREDKKLAPTLTPKERSFLQGVIQHIPSIIAMTLPTKFSYGRVMDGIWSGGTYACWGKENREAPLRLCGTPGAHHIEARFVDGTANPHLVLAAILGAGTKGIIDGETLKSGDCQKSVAAMSDQEKAEFGVTNAGRLGPTLADARKQFLNNPVMKELFSEDFVTKYAEVNKVQEELFVADTEEAEVTKVVEYW